MHIIGTIECKKAGSKFLCSGTEPMLDINLHVFRHPPLIVSIPFSTWSRHTCNTYFEVTSENYYKIS